MKNKWDIQVCTKMSFFTAAAPLKEPDELAQECGMGCLLDFSLVRFSERFQKSSLCSIYWQNYVRQKDVFVSNNIFL